MLDLLGQHNGLLVNCKGQEENKESHYSSSVAGKCTPLLLEALLLTCFPPLEGSSFHFQQWKVNAQPCRRFFPPLLLSLPWRLFSSPLPQLPTKTVTNQPSLVNFTNPLPKMHYSLQFPTNKFYGCHCSSIRSWLYLMFKLSEFL